MEEKSIYVMLVGFGIETEEFADMLQDCNLLKETDMTINMSKIDPEAFQIMSGKLLLQYSKSVRNDFNKDAAGNLEKAKANWPGLEKKGRR